MNAALALRLPVVFAAVVVVSKCFGATTSEGSVFFDGANPTGEIRVGVENDGALTITPPDALITQVLRVAESPGVIGVVDINGGGLTVNGVSNIGADGVGDLLIRDGGYFRQTSGIATIGSTGFGSVTVEGSGSLADFAGPEEGVNLFVADTEQGPSVDFSPRGEILVADGGELLTAEGWFGAGPGVSAADVVITGPGSRWRYADDTYFGYGTVTIADGARVESLTKFNPRPHLSFDDGSNALVTGVGSFLSADRLGIAESGQAVIRVENGADVSAESTFLGGDSSDISGLNAILEIDGAGTTWTTRVLSFSGRRGRTQVHITDGATLANSFFADDNDAFLGSAIGSDNLVVIDGAGSRWHHSTFEFPVGFGGRGELRVTGGAYHENDRVRFGESFAGEGHATVSGQNSLWVIRDSLQINRGSLTVADGGVAQLPFGVAVESQGSVYLEGGALTFAGIQNSMTNRGLVEGHGVIDGTLSTREGGEVRVGNGQTLSVDRFSSVGGFDPNGDETVTKINGGELRAVEVFTSTADLELTDATLRYEGQGEAISRGAEVRFLGGENRIYGEFNAISGRITVTGDSEVTFFDGFQSDADLFLTEGSTVEFLDDYAGDGAFGEGSVRFEGSVELTRGPASFGGDVNLVATASLAIHLDSFQFDQLSSDGGVDLGGALDLTAAEDALDPGVHEISVVEAASLTDEFDFLPGVGSFITPLTQFLGIEYTPTSAVVTLRQLAPGDVNGDGVIDNADLQAWGEEHGATPSTITLADANGDGRVDAADYALIREAIEAESNAPVPEPAASALLLIACLTHISKRR